MTGKDPDLGIQHGCNKYANFDQNARPLTIECRLLRACKSCGAESISSKPVLAVQVLASLCMQQKFESCAACYAEMLCLAHRRDEVLHIGKDLPALTTSLQMTAAKSLRHVFIA